MQKKNGKYRVAAIADIHTHEQSTGALSPIFSEIAAKADVLVLCGDLTDHGRVPQAEILAQELKACTIPVVAVLGNHDFETNHQDKIKQILTDAKVTMLEDDPFIFGDVGFAGAKGFGGGFENHMLGPFGEKPIKDFAHEAVNEALLLENALTRIQTKFKVVAMHYSPIKQTVVGEPPEIFPFLGSSRLVEPIDNFNVTVAFHGHAHFGTPEGKTQKGIPVYNVSMPLLLKHTKTPYRIIEL